MSAQRPAHSFSIDLPSFFGISRSFSICRDIHLWPPASTALAFFACGVDDLHGGGTVEWERLDVSDEEYLAAVAAVDPAGSIDDVGTEPGDWKSWFEEAVRRSEDENGR